LESAKTRLENTVMEKDNLVSKVNTLENKLVELQHDLNKKERDLRAQLKLAEEKCKRLESEQLIKFDKFETQTYELIF